MNFKEDKIMTKRVALVTGARVGLGQETAVELAKLGHDVALVARNACTETEERIANEAPGAKAISYQCDIRDPKQVQEMAAKVRADLGDVEILINNAGIYPFILFEELDYDAWKNYFATNVDGPYNCCQAFLPAMREKGWGRVVSISSDAFMNGQEPKLAGYISTKGAVIGLTRALASEYGPYGVTVNSVAPGLFVCDQTISNIGGAPGEIPEGEFNKWDLMIGLQSIKKYPYPSDFTGAIKFLVSEEAGFMTGQTMVVDGGIARV